MSELPPMARTVIGFTRHTGYLGGSDNQAVGNVACHRPRPGYNVREAGRTVARFDGRKVRAPQGKALVKSEAAGRERPVDGKCHRKLPPCVTRRVRVKKCGKSALSRAETPGVDKPCPVQDQYGNRTGPVRYDSRVG